MINNTLFVILAIFIGMPFLSGILGGMVGYWLSEKAWQRKLIKKGIKKL